MQPRSTDEARDDLVARGESIAQFARRHGLNESTVHSVLSGRNKGLRGQAHKAAVLLGLKIGTIPDQER